MRLNTVFHNPNPCIKTHKLVSDVFADLCISKIKDKLRQNPVSSYVSSEKKEIHTDAKTACPKRNARYP